MDSDIIRAARIIAESLDGIAEQQSRIADALGGDSGLAEVLANSFGSPYVDHRPPVAEVLRDIAKTLNGEKE